MQQHQLTPFGLMVTKALLEKEMTQVELAEALGTTKQYLSMILHGKRSGGKYSSEIEKICYSTLPFERNGRRRRNRHELTPLGCMVKQTLLKREMTQAELAKELGTSKQYLYMILHGKRPGDKYLPGIANICELNLEALTIDQNEDGGKRNE